VPTILEDGSAAIARQLGRVVFFITTNGSEQHMSFFRCWHKMVAKLPVLQKADVIIHENAAFFNKKQVQSWMARAPNRLLEIHHGSNPGYQRGALESVDAAFSNGWFDNHDWVIRINPDVYIHDEQPLLAHMQAPGTAAVFANCGWKCAAPCNTLKVHTDFFAVRVRQVPKGAFSGWRGAKNAELYATHSAFADLINAGHVEWVIAQNIDRHCRVRQNGLWHWLEDCEVTQQKHGWMDAVELRQARRGREGEQDWGGPPAVVGLGDLREDSTITVALTAPATA